MNPNKGRVTTIVASIKKQRGMGGSESPSDQPREELKEREEPETDTMAAKMAAMDSLAVALEKRDSKGMVRAMKTFLELCQGYDEDEEEPKKDQPYSSPQHGAHTRDY